MDDLQSALQQLLADPQQLAELASMASALGCIRPRAARRPSHRRNRRNRKIKSGRMRRRGRKGQGRPCRRATGREKLLMALRPFLKPERQEKLDRALRIAQLTQLAGSAFSGHNHL